MEFDLKGYSLAAVPEPSTMKGATAFGNAFNQSFDELYSKTEFEPVYHDRRIRSVRLYLDLLSLELYQTERCGAKDMMPLGLLCQPAEDLSKALAGGHANVISSILLSRHQSEWEDIG